MPEYKTEHKETTNQFLNESHQEALLQIAKQSIENGLNLQENSGLPDSVKKIRELLKPGASFVTLNKERQLRGCIGSLMAQRALGEDVAINAFNAAFKDPRFAPLQHEETLKIDLEISVLSAPEEMQEIETMEQLLDELRPFEDGLILTQGYKRATFLPSVWEQLSDKRDFVFHLMRKGGMTQWSSEMRCERYSSFKFGRHWKEI